MLKQCIFAQFFPGWVRVFADIRLSSDCSTKGAARIGPIVKHFETITLGKS